jgi:hypothetical protein
MTLLLQGVQGSRAASLPENVVPLSLGMQTKTESCSPEDLAQIAGVGARVIRRGFYWDRIETAKGVYDFAPYDRLVASAESNGLRVVACLFGSHKLYEDDGLGGIQTDAGRKGYAAFAAAAAKHFKDRNILWEIWNEPNVRSFWRKTGMHNSEPFAEEYTALVLETVPAMLAADPDCFVMAGSLSNYWEPSYQWTGFCLQKGILKSGIRAWSVHPYGVKTPEEHAVGHARVRALLDQYGAPKDFPMLNTERGYAVKDTGEGWSGGEGAKAVEYQAWQFVRQYMVDMLCGVRLTSWYEWKGNEFGLFHGAEKMPAYDACKTMVAQLGGYHLVRRLPTQSDLDYLLLFESKSGPAKLVAWTAPPAGESPDMAAEHLVRHEIGVSGALTGADIYGRSIAVASTNGVLGLTLTGGPQYVALPAKAVLGAFVKTAVPAVVRKPAAKPAAPEAGAATKHTDLKLFDKGVEWTFAKNNGEGTFTLGTDGARPIGVMAYDFTGKNPSTAVPYVLAVGPTSIPDTALDVRIGVRSPRRQKVTFRLIDSTDQTHQYKGAVAGSGDWETIQISLAKKLEHWGGANDGKVHFPITKLIFSVPAPADDPKTGKVEYADVTFGTKE